MKRLFFVAIASIAIWGVSCERTIIPDKIYDTPFVEFYDETMTVAAEGGEMVIPVTSTGVDKVFVSFQNGDSWEVDPESGDLTPKEGWITLVKVINEYDTSTRALPKWDSGICIDVEPNTTGYERRAWITVQSFTKSDTIVIMQSAGATPRYDVTVEAQYLLTEYWGDLFTPGVDNYSVIIAENKFQMDFGGASLTEGSYYCLDLYAPVTEYGNLPAGTYTLDMNESYAEWSIDGTVGGYVLVDANGNFVTAEEGIPFSEATLVVKEDYAELTAVIDGKTHFVAFAGEFSKLDSTNEDGDVIRSTTLTDDVAVEGDEAMFMAVIDGEAAQIIVTESSDANGAMFMLEVALPQNDASLSGTYSVADGTLAMGTYNDDGMWGSWYLNVVDGNLGGEYAAIHDGSVTFVQEGSSCHMTLTCSDEEGYSIKATLSGMFISESVAPAAVLSRFNEFAIK